MIKKENDLLNNTVKLPEFADKEIVAIRYLVNNEIEKRLKNPIMYDTQTTELFKSIIEKLAIFGELPKWR